MLSEDRINRVWSNLLAAEAETLYFSDSGRLRAAEAVNYRPLVLPVIKPTSRLEKHYRLKAVDSVPTESRAAAEAA